MINQGLPNFWVGLDFTLLSDKILIFKFSRRILTCQQVKHNAALPSAASVLGPSYYSCDSWALCHGLLRTPAVLFPIVTSQHVCCQEGLLTVRFTRLSDFSELCLETRESWQRVIFCADDVLWLTVGTLQWFRRAQNSPRLFVSTKETKKKKKNTNTILQMSSCSSLTANMFQM